MHHPPYSAINSHSLQKNHPIQDSNFNILDFGKEPDLHSLESLYIWHHAPKLNENLHTENILILK